MNKTLLSLSIATTLSLSVGTVQALTITWADNTMPDASYPTSNPGGYAPVPNGAFSTFNEFRMILDGNGDTTTPLTTSGGGEKSIIGETKLSGAGKATTLPHNFVSWTFDDNSGQLLSVANTDMTTGAHYYAAGCGYITGTCTNDSAAPDGGVGLFLNTFIINAPWGFLAPTLGSAAGSKYGVAEIIFSGGDLFTIDFPVLESQWNEGYETHGSVEGGVVFNCSGALSGDVSCAAEEFVDSSEDSTGWAGQTLQFELHGTLDTPQVPIPAAVWLFGSGLLGLVGMARRKKS